MKLAAFLYFLVLKTRYRFTIEWFEDIDSKKQYLVMPNHQALVDPQIVFSIVWKKISLSPVVTEKFYNLPVLNSIFRMIWAVSMVDVSNRKNSSIDEIKEVFKSIELWILDKKNILIYPAWQLYSQWYEVIRWKKTAYNLVKFIPEDVEILVIRTTGLWWSIWSKAWIWDTPNFIGTFLKSIYIVLVNFIFFVPKRDIKIKIENLTEKLKESKDLNEFNSILENYYNENWNESLNYKKHYFYFNDVTNKKLPVIKWSVEDIKEIDASLVPSEVLEKIIKKISEIKSIQEGKININSNLVIDLFFDSLDISEIKSYIQINFTNPSNPSILDLKTVWDLCYMAIWKSSSVEEIKPCNWSEINDWNINIYDILQKNITKLWENTNILTLFKEIFLKNKSDSFVYDNIFWLQTKKDFLLKAFLISSYIKQIKWNNIWVMLPSVSSSSLIIISIYLAWKVPVMLNWTVWETSLLHCVKFADIDFILTSKNFYEKIKNPWTENLKDKYIFLEVLLKNIDIKSKIKALISSIIFNIPKVKSSDIAVILFTSWSESLPKAVSLTHKNLIYDIPCSIKDFTINKSDILLWFLPPFHSFWFTINTIMPLITWLRVAYTPDPNDSKTVANLIKHTNSSLITSTPTFLKMILSVADKNDLETIKYVVVWAEKCQESLFETFKNYCPNWEIIEWYWITECSPVISINPPWKSKKWSVWLPIYWSDIKIVSLVDNTILETNKEGMIYFAWDNVFTWYLDKNLESPIWELPIDSEKWWDKHKLYYKTWDLWYLDDDWYLYITWRLKRFVKIAWEMISLPFIETILNKKYWSDTELKIAIEANEKDWNVKIVLFSVDDLILDEVSLYLRENWVSNLVKISEIIKLENIPVLWTWKIDYKILKTMVIFDKNIQKYDFWDIRWTIIKKVSELSNIDETKLNENSEFGKDIFLDSIDVWELSIFIKNNYKGTNNIVLKDIKTIKDLIKLIK